MLQRRPSHGRCSQARVPEIETSKSILCPICMSETVDFRTSLQGLAASDSGGQDAGGGCLALIVGEEQSHDLYLLLCAHAVLDCEAGAWRQHCGRCLQMTLHCSTTRSRWYARRLMRVRNRLILCLLVTCSGERRVATRSASSHAVRCIYWLDQ